MLSGGSVGKELLPVKLLKDNSELVEALFLCFVGSGLFQQYVYQSPKVPFVWGYNL